MSTTLEPSFMLAVATMTAFKPRPMLTAEAALLHIALSGVDFTASELPETITNGSKHIAGAATGALVALGLIEVVGRVKSPNPNAKGRKLDLLRLNANKRGTVLAWLRANDFPTPAEKQAEFALA